MSNLMAWYELVFLQAVAYRLQAVQQDADDEDAEETSQALEDVAVFVKRSNLPNACRWQVSSAVLPRQGVTLPMATVPLNPTPRRLNYTGFLDWLLRLNLASTLWSHFLDAWWSSMQHSEADCPWWLPRLPLVCHVSLFPCCCCHVLRQWKD